MPTQKSKVVEHPWGQVDLLISKGNYKFNEVVLGSGHRTPYQMHEYRHAVWMIVDGSGLATFDGLPTDLYRGRMVMIPPGTKHRIENIGEEELKFLEVQIGDKCSDEDIITIEDDYE